MSDGCYLAIDLGAESGRALLGEFDGQRLTAHELHRFANVPAQLPSGLHWDVLRLWNELCAGIRLAVRERGSALASVGIDTWGVDFALLDRQGALLGNPYHYRDGRTDTMLAEAFRRLSREQIFAQTGIQFHQINSLYQLLALRCADSPLLDNAATLLMIPDLFNYWLTGRQVCEFTNATTTQCYDPRQGGWASDLLTALNLPTRIFPPLVQPGTLLGPLLPTVAEASGAQGLTVVAPACHDTGSAVAAVPAEGQGFAWISSGTWSIMGTEVPTPLITPETLAFNLTNEGGVGGSFRCSKNIMGLWLVQECRRSWAAQGHDWSYAELTALASQAAPLTALVEPDAALFLKPGDMPARLRAYCAASGQVVPETPGALVRCALESIALKYRWVLECLEKVTGQRLEPIHIVGGGAQNSLLNQFTADATDRVVVAGPIEATALGNLLMQALALGHIGSLAEARAVVRRSAAPEIFVPRSSADWDAAYARFSLFDR